VKLRATQSAWLENVSSEAYSITIEPCRGETIAPWSSLTGPEAVDKLTPNFRESALHRFLD